MYRVGQHLKKSSLSESSSDMMDLEDGVDGTPNLMVDSQGMYPFDILSLIDILEA